MAPLYREYWNEIIWSVIIGTASQFSNFHPQSVTSSNGPSFRVFHSHTPKHVLNEWNYTALSLGGRFDGLILDEDGTVFM